MCSSLTHVCFGQVQDRSAIGRHERYNGVVDALRKVAAQNGVKGLYDGMWVSYFANVAKNATFFTCYETCKYLVQKTLVQTKEEEKENGIGAGLQMACGVVSGMATTLVTLPIQVVQTQKNVHSNRGAPLSAGEALRDVLRAKGVRGLYVGISPALVLSIYPAIQHTVFDSLRRRYLLLRPSCSQLPAPVAFLFGIIANVVALLLTYPLIYLKVRVQAQKVAKEHHLGTFAMAAKIIGRHGLLALWQGFQSQVTNACLSNAILFSTKERIQAFATALLTRK